MEEKLLAKEKVKLEAAQFFSRQFDFLQVNLDTASSGYWLPSLMLKANSADTGMMQSAVSNKTLEKADKSVLSALPDF